MTDGQVMILFVSGIFFGWIALMSFFEYIDENKRKRKELKELQRQYLRLQDEVKRYEFLKSIKY